MKTIRKTGKPDTVRLEAREVRILDDAAAIFRDMSHRLENCDARDHAEHMAEGIDQTVIDYGPKAKVDEAQPPFAPEKGK